MSIKEILQKQNIQVDEQEINDFFIHSEDIISDFFKEKWNMYQQEQQAFVYQVRGNKIVLPNAKKDTEYSTPFTIDNIGLPDIESFKIENLPDGLFYSEETETISGIPSVAGDHKILLQCVSKKGHKAQKELMLIVVPDPKDLWKNIPTQKSIQYYKDDSAQKFLKGDAKVHNVRKNMVAASQRGRSHANEGTPRDDDFEMFFVEQTQWYIMTVADGAGSAKFSRRGSQIACKTVVDICKDELAAATLFEQNIKQYWENKSEDTRKETYMALHNIVGKAAYEAFKNINNEAQSEKCKTKDYATTLKLVICKQFDFGWFVGAFWVGDGGIGIYNKDKAELKIMGEPDGGEFAGQTRFLTMPEIFQDRPRTRFEIVDDFTAIILMTDGVTDPKFETDANLNRIEKWNELWDDLNGNNDELVKVDFSYENEQPHEQLLKWLDFWSKGNHDDRTIAILY